MARLCPQCDEIHFETTGSPLPTHCRKCGADLNEAAGLLPVGSYEDAPADQKPKAKPKAKHPGGKWPNGLKGIVIGVSVLIVAGVLITLGVGWNTQAKEVKVEILNAPADTPKQFRRDLLTGRYSVGSKTYYAYPGLRREKETGTLYYLPDDPATTYEMRPFFTLLIGSKLFFIGLSILTIGVIKFLVARARTVDFERTMATTGG